MKARITSANQELDRIIRDMHRYPLTVNHYFTTTIQKRKQDRTSESMQKVANHHTITEGVYEYDNSNLERPVVDREKLLNSVKAKTELNMDKYACLEATDGKIVG